MNSSIVRKLTEGFDTHIRKDERVIRVRAEGRPIAEVVVGAETIRVNFRDRPASASDLHIGGKSKSWPGGGVQVTSENVDRVKALLEECVESVGATDSPTSRGRSDEPELVTIPVRRRGRKMSEATLKETLDELEAAEEEGILDEVFSGDLTELLRRRLDAARARRRDRSEAAA